MGVPIIAGSRHNPKPPGVTDASVISVTRNQARRGAVHSAMFHLLLILVAASAAGPSYFPLDEVEDPAVVRASRAAVSFDGGSGFVASADGLVVTAHHVAEMVGDRPWVRLAWLDSPGPFPVQLERVASDPNADLALYRLPAGVYAHLELRTAPAERGEVITAMAHPPRRPLLVSVGRVLEAPALWVGQPILEYTAPAYDGYSGGALLDREGRVVGVHRGWDFRDLGHGHLVAVPSGAVLEAFPQLESTPMHDPESGG